MHAYELCPLSFLCRSLHAPPPDKVELDNGQDLMELVCRAQETEDEEGPLDYTTFRVVVLRKGAVVVSVATLRCEKPPNLQVEHLPHLVSLVSGHSSSPTLSPYFSLSPFFVLSLSHPPSHPPSYALIHPGSSEPSLPNCPLLPPRKATAEPATAAC
jgi:hypothetical protein